MSLGLQRGAGAGGGVFPDRPSWFSIRSRSLRLKGNWGNRSAADLVVEDEVIVEIKALEVIAPVHKKQLLTYLRLADKRLGLLINFNVSFIRDGITRIVNGLTE